MFDIEIFHGGGYLLSLILCNILYVPEFYSSEKNCKK